MPNHGTIVPVIEPHDEDYARAMRETQAYVNETIANRCPPGTDWPAVHEIAIEALTHLVGGCVADGYRLKRKIEELEGAKR